MKRTLPFLALVICLVVSASCNREEQLEANAFISFGNINPEAADANADKDFILYTFDNEIAKGSNKIVNSGCYYIEDFAAAKAACESALKKVEGRSISCSFGVALRGTDGKYVWKGSVKAASGNTDPDEVGFIDLGLSYLWSDRNLDRWWTSADYWIIEEQYGCDIPDREDWEELWEKCDHRISPDGESMIFSGNGNSISIPCTVPYFRTYYRAWSNDDWSDGPESVAQYPNWKNGGESTVYTSGSDGGEVVSFTNQEKIGFRSSLLDEYSSSGFQSCLFDEGIIRLIRKK